MSPQPPTVRELQAARESLHAWGQQNWPGQEVPDEVLLHAFREIAADQLGLELRVHWLPAAHCYAGCWHTGGQPCEDQYYAADLDDVRLLACSTLLRDLARADGQGAPHSHDGR